MKNPVNIIAISDVHGYLDNPEKWRPKMAAADLLIVSGDLSHSGSYREFEQVVDRLRTAQPAMLAILGNCDTPDMEKKLILADGDLNDKIVVRQGIQFIGLGGALPGPQATPNVYSEEQLAQKLARLSSHLDPALPKILVSHQPPKDSGADLVAGSLAVGSQSVRGFIEKHKPALCLCGHIHESAVLGNLKETQIANPGPFAQGGYIQITVSESRVEARLLKF